MELEIDLSQYKDLRRVVCAAMRHSSGHIVCSPRHFDSLVHMQLEQLEKAGLTGWSGAEQGFVDQFGNFLTRAEARDIAERQGQILRRCGGDAKELFSENLY